MRLLIQRVTSAQVSINGDCHAAIDGGFLVFAGFAASDTPAVVDYMASKLLGLRVFEDEQGRMNHSVAEAGGSVLIVSQFTLYGDTRRGNRPSFIQAARPEQAVPLYEQLIDRIRAAGQKVASGVFGADMQVHLINDGPVTIWMDSADKFH